MLARIILFLVASQPENLCFKIVGQNCQAVGRSSDLDYACQYSASHASTVAMSSYQGSCIPEVPCLNLSPDKDTFYIVLFITLFTFYEKVCIVPGKKPRISVSLVYIYSYTKLFCFRSIVLSLIPWFFTSEIMWHR